MSSFPSFLSPPRDALFRVGAKTTSAITTEETTTTTTTEKVRHPGVGRRASAAACLLVSACAALAASLLGTALSSARTRRDARPPVAPGGAPTSAGGGGEGGATTGTTPGAGAPTTTTATTTPAPAPSSPAPARPFYASRPEPEWIDAGDCNSTHSNSTYWNGTHLSNSTNSTGPRRYLDSTDGLYYRDDDCADVALANSTAWDLRHYYNYNATAGSRFGPPAWGGVDVSSWATNETSDVTYGAGGNYWSQFDNEAFLENRCDVDGTTPQSPVDVCDGPSGQCEEFHEIRTRVSLVGRTLRRRHWRLPCVSFVCSSSFSPRPSSSSSHSSADFATASSSSFALLVRSSQFRAGTTASGTTRT